MPLLRVNVLATQTCWQRPRPEGLTLREAFCRQNPHTDSRPLADSGTALPAQKPPSGPHTYSLALPGPTSPGGKAKWSPETGFALSPQTPSCGRGEGGQHWLQGTQMGETHSLMGFSGRSGAQAPVHRPDRPQHQSSGDASLVSQAFARRLQKVGQQRQPPSLEAAPLRSNNHSFPLSSPKDMFYFILLL